MKKFLIIFVISFVLISGIGNFCLAQLSAPTPDPNTETPVNEKETSNPQVTDITREYLALMFKWEKVGDASYYHILYWSEDGKKTGNHWLIGGDHDDYEFVGGFDWNLDFTWQVAACETKDIGSCTYCSEQKFLTPQQPEPEPEECKYPCMSDEECKNKGGKCVDGKCPEDKPCCCDTGTGPIIPSPPEVPLINPLLVDTLCDLLNTLINFLFMLALALAPIVAIIAGFYLLSADPEKVKRAKQILLWLVIALTIIFLAKGLPAIIKGALGG